jgi:hypothetical protein
MPHDFFDPTPEQQNVVLINIGTPREAERLIESAILKVPKFRSINILDRVTGSDSSVTDYILNCREVPETAIERFWKRLSSSPQTSGSERKWAKFAQTAVVRRLLCAANGVNACDFAIEDGVFNVKMFSDP